MKRKLINIVLFGILALTACSKEEVATFDSTVNSLCLEQWSNVPMIEINEALESEDVIIPFTVFGTDYGVEDGCIYFDVLDKFDKVLHVTLSKESGKYIFSYMRDTPEEWKRSITNMARALVGNDADVKIADRYSAYVDVLVRGEHYRWENDRLYKPE